MSKETGSGSAASQVPVTEAGRGFVEAGIRRLGGLALNALVTLLTVAGVAMGVYSPQRDREWIKQAENEGK